MSAAAITEYIIPGVFLLIFGFATIRDLPAYDFFIDGVKSAIKIILNILPFLVSVLVMVSIFRESGLAALVAGWISPLFKAVGIPPELAEILLLRPFTGSGSLALIEKIFIDYGVDSYTARCAAVIAGSGDTVFYVAAVYFSTVKVKRLKYTIPIALVVTVFGYVLSCLLCRVM